MAENADVLRPQQSTSDNSAITPFPPTSQGNYGPAEKAADLDIITVPSDLGSKLTCNTGVLEVKFTTRKIGAKLPHLIARLKSLHYDKDMLAKCILIRTIKLTQPSNVRSSKVLSLESSSEQGSSLIDVIVLTVFLPSAGEYGLEVYGVPADSSENASYFLAWQFLIDSFMAFPLSTPIRNHLSTITLGPQNGIWDQLELKPISHADPLIHVPTEGHLVKKVSRSKLEIIDNYMQKQDTQQHQQQQLTSQNQEASNMLTVAQGESDDADLNQDPKSCDFKIVFEKQTKKNIEIVGQLVDISVDNEKDCTSYLLQQWSDKSDTESPQLLTYFVRIPKGDHFYKLYLYADFLTNENITASLPLVYTYLIEAPPRLTASEVPYVGVKWGAFPEKISKLKQ